MKSINLWNQLPERKESDGKDLYSSIKDLTQWTERNSTLKMVERAKLYLQLLVEVNNLEISVEHRIQFLQKLHIPILNLTGELSKKFVASGIPLIEEKSKLVDIVNSFWSEMATGYKIIIDDMSEGSFFNSIFKKKQNQQILSYGTYNLLYFLNRILFSNYKLYSDCTEHVWRDIHQVYRFASKRKLINITINNELSNQHTIAELYKKILLFSLANPYHLSNNEMDTIWLYLDKWSKHAHLSLVTKHVIKKQFPFFIKPFSDQPAFSSCNHRSNKITELELNEISSDLVWGMNTEKLVKIINKRKKYTLISDYLQERLVRAWTGHTSRKNERNELIEPVVIVIGLSSISQFLSQIDIAPNVIKLEDDSNQKLESSKSINTFYQAFVADESERGIRLKLSNLSNNPISPRIGEIIAIKHLDDSIQLGYLRWMRENSDRDIEFGLESLTRFAEAVQISKESIYSDDIDLSNVIDCFVFQGDKTHHFKPILFTHNFINKFYNSKLENLFLIHKTGTIKIKLVQKITKALDYSLYLFEKEVCTEKH